MAIFNESTCIDWQINYACINEVSFSLIPTFKQDPKLAKYVKDIEEAEKILKNKKVNISMEEYYSYCQTWCRICDIIINIYNIITIPCLISFIGIAGYLFFRCCSYSVRMSEESEFYMRSRSIAHKLKNVINKENDPKKKKELQKLYDKIIDNQDKLKDDNFGVRIIGKAFDARNINM